MKILSITVMTFLLASMSLQAAAGSDHHHDDDHHQQQLDAHVHGLAHMTLAIDGDQLDMAFSSPSANIVGFEHKASSTEQIQAVKEAKALLESAQNLFAFKGTQCSLETVKVNIDALLQENDEHHDDHDDKHHKDEDHHDDHEETHSEISAHYHFNCTGTAKLSAISLLLFEQFPSIETLKAEWVTQKNQGAADLSPASNTLRLR